MRRVTFHEEADSEVKEAALYCEDRDPDPGLAFLDEIEKTVVQIQLPYLEQGHDILY